MMLPMSSRASCRSMAIYRARAPTLLHTDVRMSRAQDEPAIDEGPVDLRPGERARQEPSPGFQAEQDSVAMKAQERPPLALRSVALGILLPATLVLPSTARETGSRERPKAKGRGLCEGSALGSIVTVTTSAPTARPFAAPARRRRRPGATHPAPTS